MHEPTN